MNKIAKVLWLINRERNLSKDFTRDYYISLLEYWKDNNGFISFHDQDKPGVILRHDIDRDLDRTVRMAEIEAGMDDNLNRAMFEEGDIPYCHSTYFALNTAKYWGSRDMIEALRYIQDLGHEIGWHNNVIAEWYQSGAPDIHSLIARPLAFLRSNGLLITGTAAHGDRMCKTKRFMNYNIFGFQAKGWRGWQGPTFSLEEFGLLYEAYHIPYDHYLADSYTGWNIPKRNLAPASTWETEKNKRYQVLIHPAVWRI